MSTAAHPITAYAVRTAGGVALRLDHAGALHYAAQHHGTVHRLEERTRHADEALRIAREAVIADIETNGVAVRIEGTTWWDMRHMCDPREVSPECFDMMTAAIHWGVDAGVLRQHPATPHLYAVVR